MAHQHFLGRVESLRGLAALCVAFYHGQLVLSLPGADPLYSMGMVDIVGVQAVLAKCMLILFNGPGAVAVFFVISGFVLGLSLDRCSDGFIRISALFLLRRVLRIYPAFLAALLVIVAAVSLASPTPPYAGASQWFNTWYRHPPSVNEVVSNALLLNTDMNNVAWTLRVELEMAVLFPFLYFMNRRLVPLADALVLCGFAVLCAVQPTPDTLKWTFAFYAGLMLPRWGPWITAVARESPVGAGPWVVASLVAFGITRPLCLETSLEWAIPIIETLSGSALLVYVVHIADRRWFMWLDGQMVRQLGRISYSFYVFNFIVLYLLGLLLLATVPAEALATAPFLWNCAMGIAACLSSIPIAALSYRWIERPSLEIGRRLTRVMGHKGEEKRQEEVDLAKAA